MIQECKQIVIWFDILYLRMREIAAQEMLKLDSRMRRYEESNQMTICWAYCFIVCFVYLLWCYTAQRKRAAQGWITLVGIRIRYRPSPTWSAGAAVSRPKKQNCNCADNGAECWCFSAGKVLETRNVQEKNCDVILLIKRRHFCCI